VKVGLPRGELAFSLPALVPEVPDPGSRTHLETPTMHMSPVEPKGGGVEIGPHLPPNCRCSSGKGAVV